MPYTPIGTRIAHIKVELKKISEILRCGADAMEQKTFAGEIPRHIKELRMRADAIDIALAVLEEGLLNATIAPYKDWGGDD